MAALRLLLLTLLLSIPVLSTATSYPVLYQGRYRPAEAAAQLWLEDLAHKHKYKSHSAEEILWDLHVRGSQDWITEPLFWIQRAQVKEVLGLATKRSRFSADEIQQGLESSAFLHFLASQAFLDSYHSPQNRKRSQSLEVKTLADGLWLSHHKGALRILARPENSTWARFPESYKIASNFDLSSHGDKGTWEEARSLQATYASFQKLAHSAPSDPSLPLEQRLQSAGDELRALPLKSPPGQWVSLAALNLRSYDAERERLVPVANFTPYSEEEFEAIRLAYSHNEDSIKAGRDSSLTQEQLAASLQAPYARHLAGKVYASGANKTLHYPSLAQLRAESLYYSLPLTSSAIALYALALTLFALAMRSTHRRLFILAESTVLLAFAVHTFILGLRIFILARPPVSNMYETILYVPWISLVLGGLFRLMWDSRILLAAASAASLGLLIVLQVTHLDRGLENVQAVLDSQYWLTIHVLMVVGSYGVFLLSSVLAHCDLARRAWKGTDDPALTTLILHSLYVGTALLITGTVLGGIWAAESWGRFWDWDPKESWAFISSCSYLIGIHLYSFRQIRATGLALCAALGFLVISFTWYGVNYILGTGLHSYGFGSGGELYYYLAVLFDIFLLLSLWMKAKRTVITAVNPR